MNLPWCEARGLRRTRAPKASFHGLPPPSGPIPKGVLSPLLSPPLSVFVRVRSPFRCRSSVDKQAARVVQLRLRALRVQQGSLLVHTELRPSPVLSATCVSCVLASVRVVMCHVSVTAVICDMCLSMIHGMRHLMRANHVVCRVTGLPYSLICARSRRMCMCTCSISVF